MRRPQYLSFKHISISLKAMAISYQLYAFLLLLCQALPRPQVHIHMHTYAMHEIWFSGSWPFLPLVTKAREENKKSEHVVSCKCIWILQDINHKMYMGRFGSPLFAACSVHCAVSQGIITLCAWALFLVFCYSHTSLLLPTVAVLFLTLSPPTLRSPLRFIYCLIWS